MCLGTTVTCRSCANEVFSFYRGGRCGEKKPFPAWHRVRGRHKTRRCRSCIVRDERAALQESHDFSRAVHRLKAVIEYNRGERPSPILEENLVVPSNAAQTLLDLESTLMSYNDTISEILLIANSERVLAGGPDEVHPSAQRMMQSDHWRDYLEGSRLHPFTSQQAERLDELLRHIIARDPEDIHFCSIYHQMDLCVALQSDVETSGRELNDEGRRFRFGRIAVDLDFQLRLLFGGLRGGPVAQQAQEQLPAYDSEEDDDYRDHDPPEISFQQWATGQYLYDATYNIDLSVEEALAVDIQGYEAYLHAYGNNLQYTDFTTLQRNLAGREFIFDPGPLDGPSFSTWFSPGTPQYARHRGLVQLALPDYWDEVISILPKDCGIQQGAARARTAYFEEHRRELYGHARYEHVPLMEQLRALRAQSMDIMEWARHEHPEQVAANAYLDAICTFLTVQIAIEAQPTEQQWLNVHTIAWHATISLREAVSERRRQREIGTETAVVDTDQVDEASQHRLYCLRLFNLPLTERATSQPARSAERGLDENIEVR